MRPLPAAAASFQWKTRIKSQSYTQAAAFLNNFPRPFDSCLVPGGLGQPRCSAQRPLPSIMMAICRGSRPPEISVSPNKPKPP